MRLKDKKTIVTGGASGIGRAICELFAEEGASVAIADIDVEGGQETLRRILEAGSEATFLRTDVSKEPEIEALVQATVRAFGSVDVLVNDAVAFVFGRIEDRLALGPPSLSAAAEPGLPDGVVAVEIRLFQGAG